MSVRTSPFFVLGLAEREQLGDVASRVRRAGAVRRGAARVGLEVRNVRGLPRSVFVALRCNKTFVTLRIDATLRKAVRAHSVTQSPMLREVPAAPRGARRSARYSTLGEVPDAPRGAAGAARRTGTARRARTGEQGQHTRRLLCVGPAINGE